MIFLCFIALISINGNIDSTIEADKCHTAFDLGSSDKLALELTVSSDKINNLGKAYFSYNNCTNARETRIECNSYKLIVAPSSNPASLITIKDTIPKYFQEKITALQTGDRVILEGLNYDKGEETIYLKPIVFTIE